LPATETKALYQLADLRWQPSTQHHSEYSGRFVAKKHGDKAVPPPRDKRRNSAGAGKSEAWSKGRT
jgi:hypothetical protein